MKRKAVFMDIDGTLLWKSEVAERVEAAIKKARAMGHMFFVCTGRSKVYLPMPLRDTGYLDGFVFACGMCCEVNGESVYRREFSRDELHAIARYVCKTGRACHFEGETKILSIYSTRTDFTQVNTFEELAAGFEEESIYKISIEGYHCLDDDPALFEGFEAFDMGHYADVVVKGVSKATGMQRVLEAVDIAREDCIGIGDGRNDLPMIRYAGVGVAMGNAPEDVKAEADFITETCEDDGVAVMIEKLLLNDK